MRCAGRDFEIELSRKTLTDAILAAGGLLEAVVRAQRLELLPAAYSSRRNHGSLPTESGPDATTGRSSGSSVSRGGA